MKLEFHNLAKVKRWRWGIKCLLGFRITQIYKKFSTFTFITSCTIIRETKALTLQINVLLSKSAVESKSIRYFLTTTIEGLKMKYCIEFCLKGIRITSSQSKKIKKEIFHKGAFHNYKDFFDSPPIPCCQRSFFSLTRIFDWPRTHQILSLWFFVVSFRKFEKPEVCFLVFMMPIKIKMHTEPHLEALNSGWVMHLLDREWQHFCTADYHPKRCWYT